MPDFCGTDQLGNAILLEDSAWYCHIVAMHPEMASLRNEVEATCTTADCIMESKSDADCLIHYKTSVRRPRLLIMVVANTKDGRVRTAHFAKKPTGDAQLWPPPPSTP